MEQIIEQAAMEFAEKCRIANFKGGLCYPYDNLDMRNAFEEGAKWQSKRMAWVSVNDKMPEEGHAVDSHTVYSHTKNVIVLYKNGCIGKGRRIYINETNKKGWQWSCFKSEDITHWMPWID
jgi:hypothetical protein